VLGLAVVDGRGNAFNTGGRVVKNAAGYDLTRLMIGSLGTLGVITQLTLMVRPLPEMSAFAVIPLSTLEQADSLLESLGTSSVEPTAVELTAGCELPEGPDSGTPATLWLGFESPETEVQWMLNEVAGLCRKKGLEAARKEEPEVVDSLWRGLTQQATVLPDDRLQPTLMIEVTTFPSRTVAAMKRLRDLDQDVSLHCHAGNGVLLGRFSCEADGAGPLVAKIREAIDGLGGKVVVTAYPPESRLDGRTVWGPRGDEFRVMQRIKQQFDPEGILNPGRFIFERPNANIQP
jgi:glycolate oxidase FAD binding subunit